MSSTVREIVGEDREAYSVSPHHSIRQTIQYMDDKKIGAVAICEEDTVLGVFSEQDLLRRVVLKNLDVDKVEVHKVMTSPANWISMDERYEVAKAIMVDKGHQHLIIKDHEAKYKGFVSARELIEADLKDSRELVGKLNDDYYEHQFKP